MALVAVKTPILQIGPARACLLNVWPVLPAALNRYLNMRLTVSLPGGKRLQRRVRFSRFSLCLFKMIRQYIPDPNLFREKAGQIAIDGDSGGKFGL